MSKMGLPSTILLIVPAISVCTSEDLSISGRASLDDIYAFDPRSIRQDTSVIAMAKMGIFHGPSKRRITNIADIFILLYMILTSITRRFLYKSITSERLG